MSAKRQAASGRLPANAVTSQPNVASGKRLNEQAASGKQQAGSGKVTGKPQVISRESHAASGQPSAERRKKQAVSHRRTRHDRSKAASGEP
jgi:hypothetical protein